MLIPCNYAYYITLGWYMILPKYHGYTYCMLSCLTWDKCNTKCIWGNILICISRLRDRVTIKTDSRHVVEELPNGKYEMKIKSALQSDTGVYTCKVINEYGTKQTEGRLDVSGKRNSNRNIFQNKSHNSYSRNVIVNVFWPPGSCDGQVSQHK